MLDNSTLTESSPDCPWSERSISVEQVANAKLPTEFGEFRIAGYRSLISDEEFVVIYKGEMDGDTPTLVACDALWLDKM